MPDVLIVEPLPAEVLQWTAERHTVRVAPELAREPLAFRAALAESQAAVLPPSVTVDSSVLWHATELRVLGRVSGGQEQIDLEACSRAGIEVVRGAGSAAAAEAEFVVGALLALLRRVPLVSEDGLLVGRELGACTVGLVGLTPAAERLAALLRAFGSRVLGYDVSLHASDAAWSRAGIEPVALAELVARSDATCLLMTGFARYHGLFGQRLLSRAKDQQVVVSLTHSKVFDEAALAQALRSGPLAAAWLDSLEPGALDEGKPLRHIDTLQVTPRVASTTRESRLRAAWHVARRVHEVLCSARQPLRPPAAPGASAGPAGATAPL
jgi:D-3-phosphoglycerate dehydrogenase / 2-oxoglutarate reductase